MKNADIYIYSQKPRLAGLSWLLAFALSCTQVPQDKNGSKQRSVSEAEAEDETTASANLDTGENGSLETLRAKVWVKAGTFKSPVKVSLQETSSPSAAKSFSAVSKAQLINVTNSSGAKVNEIALPMEVSIKDLTSSGKDLWILIIDSSGKKGLILKPTLSGSEVTFVTSSTNFTVVVIEALAAVPSDIDYIEENGVKTAVTTATPTPTTAVETTLAAPTGVTVTAGNGQNTLSWTAVSGAQSYKIYYKTSASGSYTTYLTTTATTKIHTGLVNNTTYYYKIVAIGADGKEGTATSEKTSAAIADLVFGTLPTITQSASFSLTIELRDAANALETGDSTTSLTIEACNSASTDATCIAPSGTLSGTLTQTAVNGVITFSGLIFDSEETIKLRVLRALSNGNFATKASSSASVGMKAIDLDTSYINGCAIKPSDSKLYCWGYNSGGKLGTGNDTTQYSPVQIGSATWKVISTGVGSSCGIQTDGTLWCWGGMTNVSVSMSPTQIGSASNWKNVSSGYGYACALKTDGTLWCFGENASGQLGNGNQTHQSNPTQVGSATDWTAISAQSSSTCGLRGEKLWCWGDNSAGQLGDGTTTRSTTPIAIAASSNWKKIALGGLHTCGIKSDDTLWCWGQNGSGALGFGNTTDSLIPAQVGSATWKYVEAGSYLTCGIKTNGTLWCWGSNDSGALGDGTSTQRTSPVQVGSATNWESVRPGGGNSGTLHTCGKRADTFYCWGADHYGSQGNGSASSASILTPTEFKFPSSCLSFNGTSSTVTLNNSALPQGTSARTVSYWFKLTQASPNWPSSPTTVAYGSGASGTPVFATGLYGDKVWLTTTATMIGSSSAYSRDTWYNMVTVTSGSPNFRILLNNSEYYNGNLGGGWNTTGTNFSVGDAFQGNIQDVRVFDRALTNGEITTLYNSGKPNFNDPIDATALVLWLKMNEGAGTTAGDSSTHNTPGTISGASWVTDCPY